MRARRHDLAGWARRLAVAVVGLAFAASPVAGKDRRPEKITAETLDALARQYREAGLLLPPPDAPATWLPSGSWEGTTGGESLPWCVVGFKVGPGNDDAGTATFLVGTQEIESTPVDPKYKLPRRLKPNGGLPTDFKPHENPQLVPERYPVNQWLVTAIQCHLRGYDRLAEQIVARGLARDVPGVQRLAPVDDGDLRGSLAASAWNHWMNVLLTAEADRPAILARLEKLVVEFPVLDGTFQRDYLASLRLTLVPGKAAPDSVEAKIDALVDYAENAGPNHTNGDEPDYESLLMLGFQAVPAFIAHLDDRRLTRALTIRPDGVSLCPRLVGDVVSDLIEDLAGAAEFPNGSYNRPLGQPADKEAVNRWWAKASAMGEETYMTKAVFPPGVVSAQFISQRYPQRMEEVYARLLAEKPEAECWVLEPAISGMARDTQRRLFRLGAASANLSRSIEAIARLGEVDRADADRLLVERLNHWPADAAGPYNGQPVETAVSLNVLGSKSAEVWQAFERALFRATPALRMEMLSRLAEYQVAGGEEVRRLALLDLFLDDPDLRVIRPEDEAAGGKFEGYPVTPETRKISVGNFVAGLLANLLNFKPPSGSAHTERWWAKYRETARVAIDQHAREGLQTPIEIP